MEIEEYIKKKKELYNKIIDFFEDTDDSDPEFKIQNLIEIFEAQEILKEEREIIDTLELISKISDNYQRGPYFIKKIELILNYLIKDKDVQIPKSKIFKIYERNKIILYLLFEKEFIKMDNLIYRDLYNIKDENNFKILFYLYPVNKSYYDEEFQAKIEEEIRDKYHESIDEFSTKCKEGSNDSYICFLIRQDLAEEFIQYINRKQIKLTSTIKPSIFETNSFLIKNEPTLIEYAAFYGSIQIIQYLKFNGVKMNPSLWLYTVHSKNADLIHLLEENEVEIYEEAINESIKCHHNDISNYIIDNKFAEWQIKDEDRLSKRFDSIILESKNYYFYPDKIDYIISRHRNLDKNEFNVSNLCYPLSFITINQTTSMIGNYSFFNYSSLTKIEIPSSVKSVGSDVFYGVKSLEITGDINTIFSGMFQNCKTLTQISIPQSVKIIGDFSFEKCISLTKVSFEESCFLEQIGNSAFNQCNALKEIIIPQSVKRIKSCAFKGCSSLTQFIIPSSVTLIENSAFYECSSLTQIKIPSSVTLIENSAFYKCSSLARIEIPSSVTSIGSDVFYGVKSLEITGDINTIFSGMFQNCKTLTQISIPQSVKNIGTSSFEKCFSLTKVSFGEPCIIEQIGNRAFNQCNSLKEIIIPSKIIGEQSFSWCKNLEKVTLLHTVEKICNYAFEECPSLKEIILPSSIKSFGYMPFDGLISVQIKGDIEIIPEDLFRRMMKLKEITLPPTVKYIGNNAFRCCKELIKITFEEPSSLTTIGNEVFAYCSSITKIHFPPTIKVIGHSCFEECNRLTELTIPSSIQNSSKISSRVKINFTASF